jgi:hypothetical protein
MIREWFLLRELIRITSRLFGPCPVAVGEKNIREPGGVVLASSVHASPLLAGNFLKGHKTFQRAAGNLES